MQGCIKDFFSPRGWAAPGGNSSGNDAVPSLPLERMQRKGQCKFSEALGRDEGDWRRNQTLCPNPAYYGHLQASENTASQKPGMQTRHGVGVGDYLYSIFLRRENGGVKYRGPAGSTEEIQPLPVVSADYATS